MKVSKVRRAFYKSAIWQGCRVAYLKKHKYICERCGEVANQVHHKTYIDDINLWDADISLNEDNLECLCIRCHNKEHKRFEKLKDGQKDFIINKRKQQGRRFYWNDKKELTPL